MVQLANLGKLRQVMETPAKSAADAAAVPMVKLEIEDPLEDEHGPLTKKPKSPGPFQQQVLSLSFGIFYCPFFCYF